VVLSAVKCIRKPAPSHVPGKDLLFFLCCIPSICFNLLQSVDCFHIPAVLCLCSALTEMFIRNVKVFGLCRLYFTHRKSSGLFTRCFFCSLYDILSFRR